MSKYKIILFLYPFFFLMFMLGCDRREIDMDLTTVFEASDSIHTATYEEGIAWWKNLANRSEFVKIRKYGMTDAGLPLHLVIIDAEENASLKSKVTCLINNGIHPGEPDGIDASMIFARELVQEEDIKKKLEKTRFLIVPFYNVGGALNRNCCSRANQNGPPSYGFRGNARNLDLNRDFIKADSRNAQTFFQIITEWDPDVYIESHVSNGADYQYTLTYLLTHSGKMMPTLSKYSREKLEAHILKSMKALNDEAIPYVNVWRTTPDSGYTAFYDLPRYSTGYLNLFNTLGMLSETHMLKPFKKRVQSTLNFFHVMADFCADNAQEILDKREKAMNELMEMDSLTLDWSTDYDRFEWLTFKGYKAYYEKSKVTGSKQLYYDNTSPWEKEIKYYREVKPGKKIKIPTYYLVPASWPKVIELLKSNGVKMDLIEKDTVIESEVYIIDNFETSSRPYEGHYFHEGTEVSGEISLRLIRNGEYYLVPTRQRAKRYLVEVLEAEAPDSYFNWNFFDEILQQKEWFSAYVFDREAEELLDDPVLKSKFDSIKEAQPDLELSPNQQLYEIYKMSDRYEKNRHMVYPVYRIVSR